MYTLELFFTLFHTLPLPNSHLNIGFLNAELQANLARNKANKVIEKIQPYTFFGLPRLNNDINVLEWSHIFNDLAKGRAPTVHYSINGYDYTMRYYLANGIYPKLVIFVKTILAPQG